MAGFESQPGILGIRRDRAELAQPTDPWRGHDQVVRELEERPFHTEIRTERQGEHECVRRDISATVIPDQQNGLVGRNAVQPPDVGPEVQRGEHPQAGQPITDVIGVAMVQVCLRHARNDLLTGPVEDVADSRYGGHPGTETLE